MMLDIDGVLVGLRTNDGALAEALAAALDAYLVDQPFRPNYEFQVAPKVTNAGARGLHLIRRGGCVVGRSEELAGAADLLLRHLGSHVAGTRSIVLRSACFVSANGEAVLAPEYVTKRIDAVARHIARSGFHALPSLDVHVDLEARELLSPQLLPHDPGPIERSLGSMSPPSWAGEDRHPIALWLVEGPARPASRAGWVAAALKGIENPLRPDLPTTADQLAGMVDLMGLLHSPVPTGAQIARDLIAAVERMGVDAWGRSGDR